MTRTATAMLGVVAIGLLAGCQSGAPGGSGGGAPAAGAALTIPQIEALMMGSSLSATRTDGSSYCAFHSTETHSSGSMIVRGVGQGGAGSFRGFYRAEPFTGAADAADPGLICYSYPDLGVFSDCRTIRQSGSTAAGVTNVSLHDRDGTLRATGTVQGGDSCGAAE